MSYIFDGKQNVAVGVGQSVFAFGLREGINHVRQSRDESANLTLGLYEPVKCTKIPMN